MKAIIIVTILLFTINIVYSQKIVSANGGSATARGYEVSWTIGEPVTATGTNGTTILTQGFHQTKITVTAIDKLQVSGIEIKVYPNPTSDFVTVHFNKLVEKPVYYLFNFSGKMVLQRNIESTETKIDMTGFTGGSYILKLNNGQKPLQSYKIIKR